MIRRDTEPSLERTLSADIGTHSLIAESTQIWKVILGVGLLIGGAATSMAFSFVPYLHALAADRWQLEVLEPVSIAVSAVGFVYLCLAVQCPECRARWIWLAVSGKLKPPSLNTLVILDRCPTCGYEGTLFRSASAETGSRIARK
jgi:hypothetical protein